MPDVGRDTPRILFITNFASHYRVPMFESLARTERIRFIFFSRGGEAFWQPHLGVSAVDVDAKVLVGPQLMPKLSLNLPYAREVFRADYDVVVCGTNGRFEMPMAWLASRVRRKPFVLWTGLWQHPSTPFHRLTEPLLRAIYRRAEAIVVYGEHVKRYVVSQGADVDKVFVAENAVNNEEFSRPADPDAVARIRGEVLAVGEGEGAAAPLTVLAVSRLIPQKGLEYLVRALGSLGTEAPSLFVAGTGPYGAELQALADERGVRLRLLGGVAQEDMVEVYDAADIFVMPSVTTPEVKETWGLACNEAMLRGVPVITSDAVGAAAGGLVVDGVTGRVVPERDERALADAISELARDSGLRRRLSDAGKERVALTTTEAMADSFRRAVAYVGGPR